MFFILGSFVSIWLQQLDAWTPCEIERIRYKKTMQTDANPMQDQCKPMQNQSNPMQTSGLLNQYFLMFLHILNPINTATNMKTRMLVENQPEITWDNARKASKSFVYAVASSSLSMSP